MTKIEGKTHIFWIILKFINELVNNFENWQITNKVKTGNTHESASNLSRDMHKIVYSKSFVTN